MLSALLALAAIAAPLPPQPEPIPLPCPCYQPEPAPAELLAFPPRWYVLEQLQTNRRHAVWLAEMIALYPQCPVWAAWKTENDRLWLVWDTLDYAWIYERTPEPRDEWLERLRLLLGDEAYHASRMPPAVPWWRFQEVR